MAATAVATRLPPAPTATPPLTSCDNIHSSAYTSMLNLRLTAWAAALFATLSFLLCVAFGLVTPGSVHMHQFLEAVLPAFEWISPGSVLLGLVESFLWGAYLGGGFALIYNALYRRWGTPALAGPAASVRSLPTDPTR